MDNGRSLELPVTVLLTQIHRSLYLLKAHRKYHRLVSKAKDELAKEVLEAIRKVEKNMALFTRQLVEIDRELTEIDRNMALRLAKNPDNTTAPPRTLRRNNEGSLKVSDVGKVTW